MRTVIRALDIAALSCVTCAALVRVTLGPYSILRALVWTALALFACALVADVEDNRR